MDEVKATLHDYLRRRPTAATRTAAARRPGRGAVVARRETTAEEWAAYRARLEDAARTFR